MMGGVPAQVLWGTIAAGAICPSCMGQAHVQSQWQKGKGSSKHLSRPRSIQGHSKSVLVLFYMLHSDAYKCSYRIIQVHMTWTGPKNSEALKLHQRSRTKALGSPIDALMSDFAEGHWGNAPMGGTHQYGCAGRCWTWHCFTHAAVFFPVIWLRAAANYHQ
eukprot:761378-Pelagomonas_calceolata.AAC.3